MKAIRLRMYIYAGMAALGGAVLVYKSIIAFAVGYPGLVSMMLATACAIPGTSLAIREYRRLKAARLIIENQILRICPARIDTREEVGSGHPDEALEVLISCFGILLGSKIIKFNQEGIKLKSVDIGRDFISLIYGTDKKIRSIRLLHGEMDSVELTGIVEKFRYETGIIPTISN